MKNLALVSVFIFKLGNTSSQELHTEDYECCRVFHRVTSTSQELIEVRSYRFSNNQLNCGLVKQVQPVFKNAGETFDSIN